MSTPIEEDEGMILGSRQRRKRARPESDWSFFWWFFTAVLIVLTWICIFFLFRTTLAHADEYTDEEIVNAIRKAEGVWNYGIKSVKCGTEKECRRVCLRTVHNNRRRYDQGHQPSEDFIKFLANRYAPIGADNDPDGLNQNWQKNVKYFLNQEKE